jgi:Domain of unknown function (DUF4350)
MDRLRERASVSPVLKKVALLSGAVVVLIAAVLAFYSKYEWVSEEVYTGFRGEAKRNRFLALGRMVERMGRETRDVANLHALDHLPPVEGTLFLLAPRYGLRNERVESALAWAHRGGHLIVVPDTLPGASDARDPILTSLGIVPDTSQEEAEDEDGDNEPSGEGAEEQNETICVDANSTHIVVPGTDKLLRISDESEVWGSELAFFGQDTRWEVRGHTLYRILQVPTGQGMVTVLSAATFMDNAHLAELDHADLAWLLATFDDRGGPVWIVSGANVPGLHQLIWRHGSLVVVSLAFLILLWIWWVQGEARRRAQPLAPLPDAARRGILEHIDATAAFLWRHRAARADLLDALRDDVLRRARERIVGWNQVAVQAHASLLAEATGLSPQVVEAALRETAPKSRAGLVKRVQGLIRLRRRL